MDLSVSRYATGNDVARMSTATRRGRRQLFQLTHVTGELHATSDGPYRSIVTSTYNLSSMSTLQFIISLSLSPTSYGIVVPNQCW